VKSRPAQDCHAISGLKPAPYTAGGNSSEVDNGSPSLYHTEPAAIACGTMVMLDASSKTKIKALRNIKNTLENSIQH
jgi:hypothetical protein